MYYVYMSMYTFYQYLISSIGKSHYQGKKGRNDYVAPYCDRM